MAARKKATTGKGKAGDKPKPDGGGIVSIPAIKTRSLVVRLVGDSPLICHQFGGKSRQEMADKQAQKVRQGKRAAKNPEQCFRDSLYPMPDGKGYGFPAQAFKKAAVRACTHIEGMTMVMARGAFHVVGDLLRIEGDPPRMREDVVRLQGKTADLRYRGEFPEWRVTLRIRYNEGVISPAHIMNLLNTAGFAVGVGEWRPERDGQFGMFHVERERE